MTVGELVLAKCAKYPSGDAFMDALESLGIWDAEVLEGRVSLFDKRGDDAPVHNGVDTAEHFRTCLVPVPPEVDYAVTSISQVKFLPEFNTWARVIVLPCKEEK
jgi:hypothetical protein